MMIELKVDRAAFLSFFPLHHRFAAFYSHSQTVRVVHGIIKEILCVFSPSPSSSSPVTVDRCFKIIDSIYSLIFISFLWFFPTAEISLRFSGKCQNIWARAEKEEIRTAWREKVVKKSTYWQMPEEDGKEEERPSRDVNANIPFIKFLDHPKVRRSKIFLHLGFSQWIKFELAIQINHLTTRSTHVWFFLLFVVEVCGSDIPLNTILRGKEHRIASVDVLSRAFAAYVIRYRWGRKGIIDLRLRKGFWGILKFWNIVENETLRFLKKYLI